MQSLHGKINLSVKLSCKKISNYPSGFYLFVGHSVSDWLDLFHRYLLITYVQDSVQGQVGTSVITMDKSHFPMWG